MKTRSNRVAGFTLIEVLMAMTISAFILASSYAVIISLAKGSESMINFTEMNTQTRMALEVFGRDARMAQDVYEFTSTKCTLLRRVWNPDTKRHDLFRFIAYEYVPSAGTFTRSVHQSRTLPKSDERVPGTLLSRETLLFDVDEVNFFYYKQKDGDFPITDKKEEVKHVQLEARLQRSVLNITNTNYIISARFMMRNNDKAN